MAIVNKSELNLVFAAYFLAGEDWSVFNKITAKYAEDRMELLSDDEQKNELLKSQVIAEKITTWLGVNGYGSTVKQGWWIDKPADLTKAIGREINRELNPTNVLLKFDSGPADGFLGLTASPTKGNANIGIKHPDLKEIETAIGIDVSSISDKYEAEFKEKFGLSDINVRKKVEIRVNPLIKKYAEETGNKVIEEIRKAITDKLKGMSNTQLRDFLLIHWLEAADEIYPPYIKAIGLGVKPPYSARIENALFNPKLVGVIKSGISVVEFGKDMIGIKAADKQILKLEVKYSFEKLASPIKIVGSSW